jgi:hypothetical protein
MIRVSNNRAAVAVLALVGTSGLDAVGRLARMNHLSLGHLFETQISPVDQARFFFVLDRLVPGRFRSYALQLLETIDPDQAWGIPHALDTRDFDVYFKGGWRSGLVHQAALVKWSTGRAAVAVLTDDDPSQDYGEETIEGIAQRLFHRPPRGPRPHAEHAPPADGRDSPAGTAPTHSA